MESLLSEPNPYSATAPETLAYIAGIVDGEGSIGLYRSRTKSGGNCYTCFVVRLHVTNTSRVLLDHILRTFGVGRIATKAPTKGKFSDRPCLEWVVTSRKATTVIEAIAPYLIIKRDRADVALRFAALALGNRGRKLSPSELSNRDAMYQEMKRLNGKAGVM